MSTRTSAWLERLGQLALFARLASCRIATVPAEAAQDMRSQIAEGT